jgi:hypothetical protein
MFTITQTCVPQKKNNSYAFGKMGMLMSMDKVEREESKKRIALSAHFLRQ